MKLDYLKETDRDVYLNLISEFHPVDLTNDQWQTFFEEYEESDSRVIYLAKSDLGLVFGTVSFLVETKAHRGLKRCIHIEDVVVSDRFRGLGLGKMMMQAAIEEAKTYNAYKIILDCSAKNIEFYEKCGFGVGEHQMRLDI